MKEIELRESHNDSFIFDVSEDASKEEAIGQHNMQQLRRRRGDAREPPFANFPDGAATRAELSAMSWKENSFMAEYKQSLGAIRKWTPVRCSISGHYLYIYASSKPTIDTDNDKNQPHLNKINLRNSVCYVDDKHKNVLVAGLLVKNKLRVQHSSEAQQWLDVFNNAKHA